MRKIWEEKKNYTNELYLQWDTNIMNLNDRELGWKAHWRRVFFFERRNFQVWASKMRVFLFVGRVEVDLLARWGAIRMDLFAASRRFSPSPWWRNVSVRRYKEHWGPLERRMDTEAASWLSGSVHRKDQGRLILNPEEIVEWQDFGLAALSCLRIRCQRTGAV